MRYDGVYAPDSDFVTRNRVRPRLRLGGIVTLKDNFEIGFRLASTPSVDKAPAAIRCQPTKHLRTTGVASPLVWIGRSHVGRQSIHRSGPALSRSANGANPPNYSENVFDVDYTPEGFAEQFFYRPNLNHTVSTYLGSTFLDEIQFSGKDPFLFLEQLRLDSKWGQRINTAFTVSGLSITSPESLTTTSVPDSNHGHLALPSSRPTT